MSLYSYLVRLETMLRSRQDITVNTLEVTVTTIGALFNSEVSFYDGSRLSIFEELETVRQQRFHRLRYKFHYQGRDGALVFRYDNSPHYSDLATFPYHKHVGDAVVEAEPPDLGKVLAEIDAILYEESE